MSLEECEKERVRPPTVVEKDGYVCLTFARTAQLGQDSVRLNSESCTEIREVGKKRAEKVGQKRTAEVGQKSAMSDMKLAMIRRRAACSIDVVLPSLRRDVRKNVENVMVAIGVNAYVTIREISKQIHVSAATVKNAEALLKEVGILFRIGGDRGGHWLISWKGER